jgi:hypothetical protein
LYTAAVFTAVMAVGIPPTIYRIPTASCRGIAT